MNDLLFTLFLLVAGAALTFEGYRIVFVKKYYDALARGIWKSDTPLLKGRELFIFNKLVGISMLFTGVMFLGLTILLLFFNGG